MGFKTKTLIIIYCLGFVFIGIPKVSYASLSMKEVKYLFEKENGEPWTDATSKKKKDFLDDIRGRGEYKKGKFKHMKRKNTEISRATSVENISKRKEVLVPHNVRAKYEYETGMNWEDASEREQENYWRKNKISEMQINIREDLRDNSIKIEEQQRRLAQERKRTAIKMKAQRRKQAKELKRIQKEVKREQARAKLERKKQEMMLRRIRSKNRH